MDMLTILYLSTMDTVRFENDEVNKKCGKHTLIGSPISTQIPVASYIKLLLILINLNYGLPINYNQQWNFNYSVIFIISF